MYFVDLFGVFDCQDMARLAAGAKQPNPVISELRATCTVPIRRIVDFIPVDSITSLMVSFEVFWVEESALLMKNMKAKSSEPEWYYCRSLPTTPYQ